MSPESSANTNTLSYSQLNDLISILRIANAKYQYLAAKSRESVCYTHHAKAKAFHLGLSINIKKARNCPQRQISVIPLPVLDLSPSPARETLKIRIPGRNQVQKEHNPIVLRPIPFHAARGVPCLNTKAGICSSRMLPQSTQPPTGSEGEQKNWSFDVPVDVDDMDYDGNYDLQYPSPSDMDLSGNDRLSDSDSSVITPENSGSSIEVIRITIKRKSPELDDHSSPDIGMEKRQRFLRRPKTVQFD
ncbi:hypothetical protein AX16_009913 [Volvariella volvacea WC 439]|nr:hypothetical protein AX16_009913 [Volvariella volvacea WC 439]